MCLVSTTKRRRGTQPRSLRTPTQSHMESLTSDELRHVATLANLHLTDDEVEKYRHQLTGILAHVQSLQQVDTDGVEPTGHATASNTVLRKDDSSTPLNREDVLENAPTTSGEFIRVRAVLD